MKQASESWLVQAAGGMLVALIASVMIMPVVTVGALEIRGWLDQRAWLDIIGSGLAVAGGCWAVGFLLVRFLVGVLAHRSDVI